MRELSGAGLVGERQSIAPGRIKLELLLSAERADAAAVGLKMSACRVERLLRLVQVLTDIFELVLEVIEGFLRFGQLLAAFLEPAGYFVPLVHERNGLQRHQKRVGRNREDVLQVEPIG